MAKTTETIYREYRCSQYLSVIPHLPKTGSVLQNVDFRVYMNSPLDEFRAFVHACGRLTTLRTLTLLFDHSFGTSHLDALRGLIRQNSPLKELSVDDGGYGFYHPQEEDPTGNWTQSWLGLADDLKQNQSLQKLSIRGLTRGLRKTEKIDRTTMASAYHQMLKQNCTLATCWLQFGNLASRKRFFCNFLSDGDVDAGAGIRFEVLDFLLSLNQAGRKKLLGPSATPQLTDWIDAMAGQDESVVYYYLRQNPSMFNNFSVPAVSDLEVLNGKKRKHLDGCTYFGSEGLAER